MSLLKPLTSLALVSMINIAAADNPATFANEVLSIPAVNTHDQVAKYEHVQFRLAKDGRWDLIRFIEPKQAAVEKIGINLLESFPVQVHVDVAGYLPNGCYGLGETHIIQDNNQFSVVINMTELQTLVACTQALVPFKVTVPLDVYGLHAGTYQVNVNGINEIFELSVDNFK